MSLPKQLVVFNNQDKEFHERWYPGRGILNFPHPFRSVLMGPPNRGKTTVIKNIILNADPGFEEIFVVHCDPGYTKEYEDIGVTMLEEIPAPEEWEGLCKTLVILEDLEYKKMKGDAYKALSRLFGYASTHKNISVMLTSQDPFEVPPVVRRCANLWVVWKMDDLQATTTCMKRTGLDLPTISYIFKNLLKKTNDSLWVDKTKGTKFPLRLNGFKPIVEDEDEETT